MEDCAKAEARGEVEEMSWAEGEVMDPPWGSKNIMDEELAPAPTPGLLLLLLLLLLAVLLPPEVMETEAAAL